MGQDSEFETAPSGPTNVAPTWTSSDKDIVITALGSSRVWATLGHGIVNEVYWPSTGEPQIRDLGFIVAGPHGWSEVKRANRYSLVTPQPHIPVPTVMHEGDTYRLTLEFAPDPARDTLLIRYFLEGQGCRLYVLLAPHLGPQSNTCTAFAGEALWARGGNAWLCLAASRGFSQGSAGVVGTSDGWQDFNANGHMTWRWRRAGPGNIALMGETAGDADVLALSFAFSREGATTLARASLASGFEAVRAAAIATWEQWARELNVPASVASLPAELSAQAMRSAAVLKAHEDRAFPGAIVASLSIPWGNSRDDLGGYHLVWTRDAVNSGFAMLAVGLHDEARRMLAYLIAMQQPDGHWAQNFFPDGRPFWKGIQLDEVGFPVVFAAKMHEAGLLAADAETQAAIRAMVNKAAAYIVRYGPRTQQDRWEENDGFNAYAIAVAVAALVGSAYWLEGAARACALELADDWNARIEDWLYSEGTEMARAQGVAGHYVRIVPRADQPIAQQIVGIRNTAGRTLAADSLVALDFLALVRFGLRRADDARIRDTVRITDSVLAVTLPNGTAYHRYNGDGYGEHDDGRPFDGTGIGRAWPLLSGERGHYALQAGDDALPYLDAMNRMTGANGMIPEQVWDTEPIGHLGLEPGRPSGSAMPLVWAHSEFLKLAVAVGTGRPIELLDCVAERYGAMAPAAPILHWRTDTPFSRIPRSATLIVEADQAFVLHFSFDDWDSVDESQSAHREFGMHGVSLPLNRGSAKLVFTRRFGERWEGNDHTILLT